MSKKKILVIAVICVVIIGGLLFVFTGRRRRSASLSTLALFEDTYEESPPINVMTDEEWQKMIDDTRKGDYWRDEEWWIEKGWINNAGQYRFETRESIARVTSEKAHTGLKSVKITIPEAPQGYLGVGRYLARYIRNPELIKEGTYEIGAWFYIPEGSDLVLYVEFEDHPSWIQFYLPNVILDTKDGSIGYYNKEYVRGYKTLGRVSFQHETWFKLWVTYDTRNHSGYTCGYESATERVFFEVNEIWTGGIQPWYFGYDALNLYAGGNNLSKENEHTLYIDDFYVKAVGGM